MRRGPAQEITWTPTMDKRLTDMRGCGEFWGLIGQSLGISGKAAIARGVVLGIDTGRLKSKEIHL